MYLERISVPLRGQPGPRLVSSDLRRTPMKKANSAKEMTEAPTANPIHPPTLAKILDKLISVATVCPTGLLKLTSVTDSALES